MSAHEAWLVVFSGEWTNTAVETLTYLTQQGAQMEYSELSTHPHVSQYVNFVSMLHVTGSQVELVKHTQPTAVA